MSVVEFFTALTVFGLSLILMALHFRLFRVREPNVISWMYIFHVLAQLIPATYYLFVPNRPASGSFFWANVLVALLIPVGGLFGSLILADKRLPDSAFYRLPCDSSLGTSRQTRTLLITWFLICLVIVISFLSFQQTYPLGVLVSGDYEEAEEMINLRRETAPGANFYIYGFALRFLMPFLFVATVASWQFLKTPFYRLLGASAMLTALFFNSFGTHKDPVALLFLLSFLTWWLRTLEVDYQSRASRRSFARIILPILAPLAMLGYPLFVFFQLPIGQQQPLSYLFVEGILGRVFWRPAQNAYLAFELFPSLFDFTWFRDVGKLASLLGHEYFNTASVVGYFKNADISNAPPPSIGTFYSQAGWWGVVIGPLVAAVIYRVCEDLIFSLGRKTTLTIALYAILLYGAFRFSWGYFHTIFLTECIVPTMLTWGLWNVCRGFQASQFLVLSPRPEIKADAP